jgi:hypothetical protein
MPAPSAEVFDRLRQLSAIKDISARPSKTIDEVFTGEPLTTIPVGTADDVEAAFVGRAGGDRRFDGQRELLRARRRRPAQAA